MPITYSLAGAAYCDGQCSLAALERVTGSGGLPRHRLLRQWVLNPVATRLAAVTGWNIELDLLMNALLDRRHLQFCGLAQ